MSIKELEKKEKARLYQKAYREANKESLAKKRREYYEANKEKISKQMKDYHEANRDTLIENQKEYYKANKDNMNAQSRAWYKENKDKVKAYRETNKDKIKVQSAQRNKRYTASKTLDYNIVYCIPNYNGKGDNYAGVTNQPDIRMVGHKSKGKLNTSEWYELDRIVDRKEAEAKEKEYHEQGYHGMNEGLYT